MNKIKCANFEICETLANKSMIETHNGCCLDCDMKYGEWKNGKGHLKFVDDIDCCICLESSKRGVSMPFCSHFLCIKCFKEMHDDVEFFEQPRFPYPLLEEKWEWAEPKEQERMMIEKPVIRLWSKILDALEDMREALQVEKEERRKCPLCRAA